MMKNLVENYCLPGGDRAAMEVYRYRLRKGLSERAFIFFIDDLDRCQADSVVQVFESIKLFLGDIPGCIFFLGMDYEQIQKAITSAYRQTNDDRFNEAEYLEKIVQMIVEIPAFVQDGNNHHSGESSSSKPYYVGKFTDHLFKSYDISEKHSVVKDIFIKSGFKTPRAIKRMFNEYFFSIKSIADNDPHDQKLRAHARLSIIKLINLELFKTVVNDPFLLWAWERYCKFDLFLWDAGDAEKIWAQEREIFEPEHLTWKGINFSWGDWMTFRNNKDAKNVGSAPYPRFEINIEYMRLIHKWDNFYKRWGKSEYFHANLFREDLNEEEYLKDN